MKHYFYSLVDALTERLQADEVLLCALNGERSDFVRLNHNRVRQAGTVQQFELSLDLIEGQRHATARCQMSTDWQSDMQRLTVLIDALRRQRQSLGDDPFLLYNATPESSDRSGERHSLTGAEATHEIITAADGLDLVGLYAGGPVYRGFANSLGQRNWFSTARFNFDWTCYEHADKAVKARYAGSQWSTETLAHTLARVRAELETMRRPAVRLAPGHYRVYLAPDAVAEILSTVGWGGFGLKSHRTRQTPLIKLVQGSRTLAPSVQLVEHNAETLAPRFTAEGFIMPKRVVLIADGRHAGCLTNARSASEYGVAVNAAGEVPRALTLAPGTITADERLEALDNGLYINNLWYTNFSDRNDCRITGMTRFACFQVKNGRITSPIEVMRFDESLYNMLGTHLLGLSAERELIVDSDTYERRSLSHMRLPGLLIDRFHLTL